VPDHPPAPWVNRDLARAPLRLARGLSASRAGPSCRLRGRATAAQSRLTRTTNTEISKCIQRRTHASLIGIDRND